ncbi:MAG: tRNA (adenosine(37)-N6)-threonylcarbamoyltransferase complex ATPase subunit type 1 TsaE [Lautropia sp.]|nr:tRNA (adenosine(37)-N6)-threonylcarbamoyltransferase complex ATPase subunit type 1 TsaE [Lautropia sp.]
MSTKLQQYVLTDERQTACWAQALASALSAQDLDKQAFLITLQGELGAGKTTLTRFLLQALGVKGRIKSPSYPLLESYNLPRFPVYHFDLYRFSSPEQWFDAGFDDLFAGAGLMLVEWPEQAAGALPAADLGLQLTLTSASEARHLEAHAHSARGTQCLTQITHIPTADDAC